MHDIRLTILLICFIMFSLIGAMFGISEIPALNLASVAALAALGAAGVYLLMPYPQTVMEKTMADYGNQFSEDDIQAVVLDNQVRIARLATLKNSIHDSLEKLSVNIPSATPITLRIGDVISRANGIISSFKEEPAQMDVFRMGLRRYLDSALNVMEKYYFYIRHYESQRDLTEITAISDESHKALRDILGAFDTISTKRISDDKQNLQIEIKLLDSVIKL